MGLDIPQVFEAHLLWAFAAGIIGGVVVTVILFLAKVIGIDFDPPYLIGSYFVNPENTSKVYLSGFILEILMGGIWGVLFVISMIGVSIEPTWISGILWGFAIGIIVGVIMSTITQSHPIMGKGKEIEEPGILGSNWSSFIPIIILGVHVIFGIVTLYTYRHIFGSVIHFP